MSASGPVSRRAAIASLAAAALAAGCKSDGDKLELGALESVRIDGFSPGTIGGLVKAEFSGRGFEVARDTERELWFERPASKADQARYGEWFDRELWMRIAVTLRETGGGAVDARSDPFLLRSRGTSTEDRQPLARRRVSEYGGILRGVQAKLAAGEFK
ncbi:MAG: hypothetical protein ACKVYV_15335 [Limisphaerales bacterium]